MRSWHYLDYPKGTEYLPNNKENIVNRLLISFNELLHKKTLCSDQIKTDLLVILHLMGDLSMPLHTGYEDDLGGNKKMVQYDTIKTHNLHRFWDEDIIWISHTTDADCLKYYNSKDLDSMKTVDIEAWMKDSRSLLPQDYSFEGFELNKPYLERNKVVVQKQLLKAAMRLALMLNKLFYSSTPAANFPALTAKYKNGIDVKEAINNIGKKVMVCSRIVAIRATSTITQISLSEKYPNSPLTIIVFAKSYSKFKMSLEELLKDKNVCVQGTIQDYKGKPQIIVEDADDIIIVDDFLLAPQNRMR